MAPIHPDIEKINAAGMALGKKLDAKMVFLFGSYAYGKPRADSDLDLCVVMNLFGKRKIEAIREARRELAKSISMPMDIIVLEESEFLERAELASTLEHKILEEGIKIYEEQRHRTGMVQGG